MAPRRKLIEVALPLEAINAASAKEKSIRHGHPSTLHLWWARRPLAAARAILFAQLVDDPSSVQEEFPTIEDQEAERRRLFAIIEKMVPWERSRDEAILGEARREIARSWARDHRSPLGDRIRAGGATDADVRTYLATEVPPVHDPFASGGTIPLEAQRLGLRAIATDLNPVAVLINKALIEIPPRFADRPPVHPEARRTADLKTWKGAQGLAEDVRRYGAWMREEAQKRIGHLYPDVELPKEHGGGRAKVIAWLWARTVASPDPGFAGVHVPLVSSYWLSKKEGKKTWLDPVVEGKTWRFEIRTGKPSNEDRISTGTKSGRGAFRCIVSGAAIGGEHIRAEGMAGRLGSRLIAVVAEGTRERLYLPASPAQERAAIAEPPEWSPEGSVPARLTGGTCFGYGLTTWASLFTARQLRALTTFAELVGEVRRRARVDAVEAGLADDHLVLHAGGQGASAYADAVTTYLACVHSAVLDDLSTIVTWRPSHGTGATRSTFARQALPMTWDFAEANPFADAGGDLASSTKAVSMVVDALSAGAPSQASTGDVVHLIGDHGAIISTDPPYYDNIGYAALSDFFYVWLRRTLGDVFPRETATMLVPKEAEIIASPHRHGGRDKAEAFFLDNMTKALRAIATRAVSDVPTTIYYAYKQSESDEEGEASTGWETFLAAVLESGFAIDGTWPVRTERGGRSIEIGTNALASSIVLVCRPRDPSAPATTRGDLRRALRAELPAALQALQHARIAPVDLAQAAIGPGMMVFSRFSKVVEADGASMTVRAAQQLINEVLDEHLAEGEADYDDDTRFAITWFEQRGYDEGKYGDAETLAKARNVSVAGVAGAGVVKSSAGRVRLLRRDELRPIDRAPDVGERSIWELTQQLIRRLESEGERPAAELLAQLGRRKEDVQALAYRLYVACSQRKWAEEARAYNGLVVSWPDLEMLAPAEPAPPRNPQGNLFGS